MFTDYATELNTPAGPLTIMGKSHTPVPFDKDFLCKNKVAGITCIDLHIELTLLPLKEEQSPCLKNAPITGWKATNDGFIWLKALEGGTTMAISVLDPSDTAGGFSIVGEASRATLKKAPQEDEALAIIANDPAPDTFLQITVAWGRTEDLAMLALQHIMKVQG